MERGIYSVIIGSGCYIPTRKIPNDHFLENIFLDTNGEKIERSNADIIRQFEKITGNKGKEICHRRPDDIRYWLFSPPVKL